MAGQISRRDMMALCGLAAIAPFRLATASPVRTRRILPEALDQNDRVAVIALSSPDEGQDDFDKARELIRHLRCNLEYGVHTASVNQIFAGSDEQKLDDFHRALVDPGIKAIMLLRGGYGAQRLLDRIDYDLIRRNPKIILGYSDVTALLIAITQRTGLVTFHGPVAAGTNSYFSETWLRHAIGDPQPLGCYGTPQGRNFELVSMRDGKARGELIGGNLTLLTTSLGTPYEVDCRGKILFIEDIGEVPYRIDRMLNQLRLAGKFDQCAGLAVGQFVDCDPKNPKDTFTWVASLEGMVKGLAKPIVRGFAIGHIVNKITVPVGVMAELDGDRPSLTVLEGAVSARR